MKEEEEEEEESRNQNSPKAFGELNIKIVPYIFIT